MVHSRNKQMTLLRLCEFCYSAQVGSNNCSALIQLIFKLLYNDGLMGTLMGFQNTGL